MDKFKLKKNCDLKDYCTFHIGGKAKFLLVVKDINTLIEVCLYCQTHNIKYKIIGLGANLLFDDKGYDGLIIVNQCDKIRFFGKSVFVESGANVTNLIMKCYHRSLCGFERLAGIPSTVGGAVVNSLGAFDTDFCDFVEYVECYHKNDLTKKLKLSQDECKFAYRSSLFKCGDYIITRVKLKLNRDDKELIKAHIKEAIEKKRTTQPLNYPSAGSVFKRSNISRIL